MAPVAEHVESTRVYKSFKLSNDVYELLDVKDKASATSSDAESGSDKKSEMKSKGVQKLQILSLVGEKVNIRSRKEQQKHR